MNGKTAVDWLRFRTQAPVSAGLDALRPMYGNLGEYVRLDEVGRGRDGWQRGASVYLCDVPIGRVDFGGESQRGWARWNLTGDGCGWVMEWDALDEVEALSDCEIKRLDIALTTWRGEVSHDMVRSAHATGGFCRGGRPPELQTIESTNPRAGRTCYVGKREKSDQFFRGYEKGFEMIKPLEAAGLHCTEVQGFPVEGIYRCEVEFKDASRAIPWAAIERRDEYFAGAYPFLASLLPEVEGDILMRRPEREPKRQLEAALANCRRAYGSTLFTALEAFGGDVERVWRAVCGTTHSKPLVEAGVLMVQHHEA